MMRGMDDILTLQEAAKLLKVHDNTVRNLLRRGDLVGFQIGRNWRFRRAVVEEYIAQRERLVKVKE